MATARAKRQAAAARQKASFKKARHDTTTFQSLAQRSHGILIGWGCNAEDAVERELRGINIPFTVLDGSTLYAQERGPETARTRGFDQWQKLLRKPRETSGHRVTVVYGLDALEPDTAKKLLEPLLRRMRQLKRLCIFPVLDIYAVQMCALRRHLPQLRSYHFAYDVAASELLVPQRVFHTLVSGEAQRIVDVMNEVDIHWHRKACLLLQHPSAKRHRCVDTCNVFQYMQQAYDLEPPRCANLSLPDPHWQSWCSMAKERSDFRYCQSACRSLAHTQQCQVALCVANNNTTQYRHCVDVNIAAAAVHVIYANLQLATTTPSDDNDVEQSSILELWTPQGSSKISTALSNVLLPTTTHYDPHGTTAVQSQLLNVYNGAYTRAFQQNPPAVGEKSNTSHNSAGEGERPSSQAICQAFDHYLDRHATSLEIQDQAAWYDSLSEQIAATLSVGALRAMVQTTHPKKDVYYQRQLQTIIKRNVACQPKQGRDSLTTQRQRSREEEDRRTTQAKCKALFETKYGYAKLAAQTQKRKKGFTPKLSKEEMASIKQHQHAVRTSTGLGFHELGKEYFFFLKDMSARRRIDWMAEVESEFNKTMRTAQQLQYVLQELLPNQPNAQGTILEYFDQYRLHELLDDPSYQTFFFRLDLSHLHPHVPRDLMRSIMLWRLERPTTVAPTTRATTTTAPTKKRNTKVRRRNTTLKPNAKRQPDATNDTNDTNIEPLMLLPNPTTCSTTPTTMSTAELSTAKHYKWAQSKTKPKRHTTKKADRCGARKKGKSKSQRST
jgi:hypothetical protein